ncbi:MAG: HAD-IA family hydrolase [Thermodesulfobacteriota bacterium]|nr:HAD-IA family hydrolase [Thermodesulfobacteriota bacterium]
MKKIKLMVFDFDGTLIYSGDDLANSVNHTLKTLGIAVLDRKTIIGFVGDGVARLIKRSLGDNHNGMFDEAMEVFKTHYAEHLLDTTVLYSGVTDMLDHFKDRKKLIVTNKLYRYTLKIANELGITGYFEDIIGLDSTSFQKPDPVLLAPLLEKYGVDKSEAVVIGDGASDIMLARNTGTRSCALLNGLGDRDMLLSLDPDYHCEKISELKDLME